MFSFASRCPFPRIRIVPIALLTIIFLTSLPVSAQQASAPEHPAIRQILAMVQAGVGDDVIVARIQQMEAVPELSGEEIARLRQNGVSDRVLLELVQRAHVGEDARSTSHAPSSSPDSSSRTARLRVVIESSFPVTYYEVEVSGQIVATRGESFEGTSEPGRILKQPLPFRLVKPAVAYEDEVEPGEHRVLVGFSVCRVEEDPNDDWMEYSRQQYISSGVQAEDGPGPTKAWSANQAAVCRVEEGQLCVVSAQFGKRSPTRFGGLPIYSVTYRVKVSPMCR